MLVTGGECTRQKNALTTHGGSLNPRPRPRIIAHTQEGRRHTAYHHYQAMHMYKVLLKTYKQSK